VALAGAVAERIAAVTGTINVRMPTLRHKDRALSSPKEKRVCHASKGLVARR
jgi:hypothetical protein